MTWRLFVACVVIGVAGAATLAWQVRSDVAYAVEPARPPTTPTDTAEVWAAVAEGCVRSGGSFWMGTESGVVVARCRPFIDLGVSKLARR